MIIIATEIAEMDIINKPCYYSGKGKSKGSYIRIGETDLPMTEYEIYNYDSFKYKTEDELRINPRIDDLIFNQIQLDGFFAKAVTIKPNLVNGDRNELIKLNVLSDKNGIPIVCGTIPQILETAMAFLQQNMAKSTVIDENGKKQDVSKYPLKAIREIILNALIHRDYSIHTENEPIRLEMYPDRIEVSNPGGLYGRLSLDELGKTKADIRNPFIASVLEILNETENRYSGIPTIYSEMDKVGLLPPNFENLRGTFKVTLYNKKGMNNEFQMRIIEFCKKPRSKEILAKEFGFDEKHPSYFMNTYIIPLIEKGKLKYTIPDKPKSKNQQIVAIYKNKN